MLAVFQEEKTDKRWEEVCQRPSWDKVEARLRGRGGDKGTDKGTPRTRSPVGEEGLVQTRFELVGLGGGRGNVATRSLHEEAARNFDSASGKVVGNKCL